MSPAPSAPAPSAPAPSALDVVCHRHEPRLAPLVTGAVLPAAWAARRHGVRSHVERHWLHGPHLRVRLSSDSGTDGTAALATAAAEVRDTLTAFVAAHPSRAVVTHAELLARSVANGRAELVAGPYEPIHPDGTVRVETPDDSRIAALLGSPAVAVRAALLAAALPALDAAARATQAGGPGDARTAADARVRTALTAMTAHAVRYPTGLAGGHHSFLSHVEDFLHLHDPHGRARARFAAQWDRHGDRVTAAVERVAVDGPADAAERAWAAWVERAWHICPPAHARGELPLVQGPEYALRARAFDAATAARWDPATRTVGDYHRRLRMVDYVTGHERDVASYRFTTNVLYRLLPVCDVTPLERLLAAYLLAAAAQRLTGRSWRRDMPAPTPDVRHPAGRTT